MKTHEYELHYHYNKTCRIQNISFIEGIDCFGRKFYDNDKEKIGSINPQTVKQYVGESTMTTIHRNTLTNTRDIMCF